MMHKPAAFITYGWCRSSYAVLASLARRGVQVHVGDASVLAMARFSRYAASFTRLPDFFCQPQAYVEAVCAALRKTGARVLLPCHEDVGLFSRYRDRLPDDVYLAVPDWQTYQAAEDKLRLMEIAADVGCPAPAVHTVADISQLESLAAELAFPVVIKTRIGNSAKGVAIAHDQQEFKKKFHFLINTYDLKEDRWPFIQEYLPGKAIGVCALYRHGEKIAWFGEQYLRCKESGCFGTSTLRKPFLDDRIIEQSLLVLDGLKWHGLAHLDLIQDRHGDFKIIEINPRPWGAMALAVHAGIDFPWLWYKTALEEEVDKGHRNVRDIYCRWILGDCLAFINRLKQGRFSEAIQILKWQSPCKHDDFRTSDPLPFFFQYLDYAGKFIRAGGNMNPTVGAMVH